MSEETELETAIHLPPKFNLEGRYQFWFVEGVPQENLVNGMLTGAVFAVVMLAVWTAGGAI